MDLDSLLRICKAYSNLGDAVAEQIHNAADGGMDECNPNALKMIDEKFLRLVQRVACPSDDEQLRDEVATLSQEISAYLNGPPDCEHCGGDGIEPAEPSGELEGEGEDRPCTQCSER